MFAQMIHVMCKILNFAIICTLYTLYIEHQILYGIQGLYFITWAGGLDPSIVSDVHKRFAVLSHFM